MSNCIIKTITCIVSFVLLSIVSTFPAFASEEPIQQDSIIGEWIMLSPAAINSKETAISGHTFVRGEDEGTFEVIGKTITIHVDGQSHTMSLYLLEDAGVAFLHDDNNDTVARQNNQRKNTWNDFSANCDFVLLTSSGKALLKGNKSVGEYVCTNGQFFFVDKDEYFGGKMQVLSSDAFYVDFNVSDLFGVDISSFVDADVLDLVSHLYFVRTSVFE